MVYKKNLSLKEYLEGKNEYLGLSIDIDSIDEDFVLGEYFEKLMEGIKKISFNINDITKDIKSYKPLLAFLNIVKTKDILTHNKITIEVEYSGKESEERIKEIYEELNLWDLELLIKPANEGIYIESYINFLLPFIDKAINKDLLISIEPINSFIEKQTTNIYNKIANTNQEFEYNILVEKLVKDIVKKEDFEKIEEYSMSSLTPSQNNDIEEMINIVIKSLVDGLDEQKDIKSNKID